MYLLTEALFRWKEVCFNVSCNSFQISCDLKQRVFRCLLLLLLGHVNMAVPVQMSTTAAAPPPTFSSRRFSENLITNMSHSFNLKDNYFRKIAYCRLPFPPNRTNPKKIPNLPSIYRRSRLSFLHQ